MGIYNRLVIAKHKTCNNLEYLVEYNSTKHKQLAEELATWWSMQTQFKTKKALAAFLKMHPDTVGDYFSGRKFPRSDTAYRL